MRRFVGFVVVVVAAGCMRGNSDSPVREHLTPPTQLNADWVCRQYVPGPLVSSEATTVGDFRNTTIGTRGPAQVHRFPELPGAASAAWCWTGTPGAYNVYEVTPDGDVQQVASNMNGVAPADAHGAPFVP